MTFIPRFTRHMQSWTNRVYLKRIKRDIEFI